jgi:pimeloyl-ACP methyl ester carboxylesterase
VGNKKKAVGTIITMIRKIFILHGWTYSTEKWEPFVELLKNKNFDPVLLKIPGLTTELTKVWTLDDYVEWLKDVVDHEKEKVVLLGHSNGGRISLAFSLKYPEKVAKIFLVDSAGIYHNELQLRVKRLFFGTIAKMGKNIKDVKAVRKIFYRLVRERDYEKANPLLRQTMKNLINSDLTPVLEQIAIPTIIIWGGLDKITPAKDGELMHEKIKQSTFHIIKDGRHSPQFTHAEEVAKIVYANL